MGGVKRKRALFVLASLALVAALIELGSWLALVAQQGVGAPGELRHARLRISHGRDVLDERLAAHMPPRLRREQVIHPYLGFVMHPSENRTSQWAEKAGLPADAIAFGFPYSRAPLFPEPSAEGLRVAVVGGSVAAVMASANGEALAEELARAARFGGREIAVVGLAQPGFKQPQSLLAIEYLRTLGAHFDLVIVLDGFNEVTLAPAELVPQGVFPFYPQKWKHRVAPLRREIRAAIGSQTVLGGLRRQLAESFGRPPWRYSATALLVWSRLDATLAARASAAQASARVQSRRDDDYQALGPERRYADTAAMYDDLAAVWERSSLQLHQIALSAGFEYFHFLQPNQYDEGAKPLSEEERARFWRADHPYREGVRQGYPKLRSRGKALRLRGVRFVDLTRLFEREAATLYMDDCCHLNREGSERLARAVGRAIARAPEPAAPGERTR